jgi:hypothetical protein
VPEQDQTAGKRFEQCNPRVISVAPLAEASKETIMTADTTNHAKPKIEDLTKNELGDLADNSFAFLMIEKLIATCRIKEALDELRALRDHIKRSNDIKSRVHLLGRVEAQILSLDAQG